MREVIISKNYNLHAEGSVLISTGNTQVICTASVSSQLPRFLQNSSQGWVTAEYGMLPRSTHRRMDREASKGKQSGRTLEIQRLIGRSLRAAVDLSALKDICITVDCDVIQADGGTRTAAITGGCVALHQAIQHIIQTKKLKSNPFKQWIAATSTGIVQGNTQLDLNYEQDSSADTDMNIVMNEEGHLIEIQGIAEKKPFTQGQRLEMLELSKNHIYHLIEKQKEASTCQ